MESVVVGSVVRVLLGWLKLVVRERRRAEKGEGNGAGARLIVLDIVIDDDGDDDNSSMVLSKPSKKVTRSGTALVKVWMVMGGRRRELVLLSRECIMKTSASNGQSRLEADDVW